MSTEERACDILCEVCEVWRGAILLSHRLFAGDLGLIMTGAAAISGNDLAAAALDSYHSYLYIHHFIFSSFVYSTRSTHIYRLLDLLLCGCYWMYSAISMGMSDVNISLKLKSLLSGYGKGWFNVSAVSLIS